MALIKISGFLGENRAIHPSLLADGLGVTSLNQKPGRADLRPWNAPLAVATVGAGRKTIYRMGRDVASDTNYWLSWTTDVSVVRGFNEADNGERTYYTGDGTPKWTDTVKALAAAPYPTSARELGIPAPASICTLVASGGSSTLLETRYYSYTYVSDIGEESAPAQPSLALTCKTDDGVAISNLAAAPAGNYGINRIRIYRTQTGQAGDASFFFLREIVSTLTSSTDDGRALGEVLPSTTWLIPPPGLKQLVGLWNGMLAGISGRSVRFCEAYVPYAWPIAYEILPSHTTPVALGTFGQTLLILTNGSPILSTGGSPDSMDEQPMDFNQACVAPKSVVSMGHGVAWASPDGLCYVGSGGARILTEGMMTRDDWQALVPATIIGCMYERRYLGFYTVAGVQKGFMLDPQNPTGLYFLDFGADAVYFDDLQDALYVLQGTSIKKWDAGAALNVTFKSKIFQLPRPMASFSCAQVLADSYPVSFKLYADGALKHTQTVANSNPFRLPGGYCAQDAQVELVSAHPVQSMALAHSLHEISKT